MNPVFKKADPSWWNQHHASGWERAKEAFKRDWDQTKHDLGAKLPNLKQNVGDTISQAMGKEPIPPKYTPNFEDVEYGYRFGYGARNQYGAQYPIWNEDLEQTLQKDWDAASSSCPCRWEDYRSVVRRGYDHPGR